MITVAAWGETHCKLTITLGPPILGRVYTAVMNGNRVSISGPEALAASAPLPVNPNLGCALLPEGLALSRLVAGGEATLTLDPVTRQPAGLSWQEDGHSVALTYSGNQVIAGLPLPMTVTEAVGGATKLTVRFASVTAQVFTESDFAVPPAPGQKPKSSDENAVGGGR